jgi:hypothetical protein
MPFDINSEGNVDITPLVSYEHGTFADEWCGLRLTFARREDVLGTGSLIVQTSLTVDQAVSLAQDLQKMVDHIAKAKANIRIQQLNPTAAGHSSRQLPYRSVWECPTNTRFPESRCHPLQTTACGQSIPSSKPGKRDFVARFLVF